MLTFLGSDSLDPNIWLPFLDPNIRTLLWWKYIKEVVIMWLAWQTWLTQPGKFNLQLQSPSWNYDPNIRMRLDPKKMVQHKVYTPNFGVTCQGQKVFHVDPHFGVQWLIQYFWCHFQVQTQIFGWNLNLNPLIQSGPVVEPVQLPVIGCNVWMHSYCTSIFAKLQTNTKCCWR